MHACDHCKKIVCQVTLIGGLLLCFLCAELMEFLHEGGLESKHVEPYNKAPVRAVDYFVTPESGDTLVTGSTNLPILSG